MANHTVLVLGATGNIGRPLVAALLARGERVRAATRSVTTAVDGATPVRFDYDDPSTYDAALDGVDSAYLMLPSGYPRHERLKQIIDVATARRVKVVVQSVLGANSPGPAPIVASYRDIELHAIAAGATHVVLRPGWFADNFHVKWRADVAAGELALPMGDAAATFIDARDIAACAAAALTTDRFDGRAFDLTGSESLGLRQATEILSRAIGRTVRYTPITDDRFVATLVAAGVAERQAHGHLSLFRFAREGDAGMVSDGVAMLTGRSARSLGTYARDHRAELSG